MWKGPSGIDDVVMGHFVISIVLSAEEKYKNDDVVQEIFMLALVAN